MYIHTYDHFNKYIVNFIVYVLFYAFLILNLFLVQHNIVLTFMLLPNDISICSISIICESTHRNCHNAFAWVLHVTISVQSSVVLYNTVNVSFFIFNSYIICYLAGSFPFTLVVLFPLFPPVRLARSANSSALLKYETIKSNHRVMIKFSFIKSSIVINVMQDR
jgi:hypothetical protein